MRKVTTASILILHFFCLTLISYSSPTNTQLKHPVFEKRAPESPEDLLAIEKQVRSVLQTSKKATVCVQGNGSGSGVIISQEGLVLTAGHVSGEPGKKLTVVLQDGTKLEAKALGRSSAADSGLIQITKEGKYP